MKLHLIGGFLGSGKTTAITNASLLLKNKGILAGVITNDQGNYLVDSSFAKALEIPSGEVTGGCFCCNYNDLDEQINILLEKEQPKVIFAESVGSCTDLVATVLRPLVDNNEDEIEHISFSVFVDSQLLLAHLQGNNLGFSDEVSYFFKKQIEEAAVLVINKVDLLSEDELNLVAKLANERFTWKKLLFQNSLELESVEQWITAIDDSMLTRNTKVLNIDYNKYGKGEADLAWLDEEVEILKENAFHVAVEIIDKVYTSLKEQNISIGHLKFLLNNGEQSQKVSFTTVPQNDWKSELKVFQGEKITLMLNARAQTTPENLREIVVSVLDEVKTGTGAEINEYCVSAFKPGFPTPTFRYAV
jgi:Ni2+-binding GTPase involved in maturation of urease and hydrogenase